MKNSQLLKQAVFSSFGVLAYIFIVANIMISAEKIFGMTDTILAPITFLLLFVFSALFTGALILGRPIMLYLDGRKKEGVWLLLYTGASLLGWLLLVFLILFLVR